MSQYAPRIRRSSIYDRIETEKPNFVEETEHERHNERPKQGKEERGASGLMLSNLAFVKFTWHLPLLIIKQLAPEKGPGEHNLVPPGTGMCPRGPWKADSGAR